MECTALSDAWVQRLHAVALKRQLLQLLQRPYLVREQLNHVAVDNEDLECGRKGGQQGAREARDDVAREDEAVQARQTGEHHGEACDLVVRDVQNLHVT